jgi:hypothetical protein
MYLAEEESDDVVKILDFVIDNKQKTWRRKSTRYIILYTIWFDLIYCV